MSSFLRSSTLFRSDTLAIRDVCCSSPRCGCTPEEASSVHSFAFVRSGVFIKHVRGRQVVADPTRVVLFSPNEPYRVSHPCDAGDRCTVFSPSRSLVRDALAEHDPGAADTADAALPADAPADPKSFLGQSLLARALARGGVTPLAVEDAACRILRDLMTAAFRRHDTSPRRRADTTTAHRELADAARTILGRHYRERLSLSDLSRRVHASPFHVSRVFHAVTGLTLPRYANRLRLREALARLVDGEGDLTRVALACGFYDHSHFANAFRREFALSPSAVRRDSLAEMSNSIQV